MHINFPIILLSALVPIALGFIWYNPKVFGNAWMNAAGMTPEKMKGANIAGVFVLTFILSFIMAFELQWMVIHQFHVYSMFAHTPDVFSANPTSGIGQMVKGMMDQYGNEFRTFKHGALHGTIGGITLALPIIGVNALFERKSFKYVAINAGFWTVNMALMGGLLCAFP